MKKYIIIAAILIVGFVLLFLLFTRPMSSPINNQPLINNQAIINNQPLVNNQPQELTLEQEADLRKKELMIEARNFIERYGSFSTDSQFTNLYELKDEMTNRFWQETEKYIASQQIKKSQEFYGVSTKVLNISENNSSNNLIIYSALTQRKETKNQTEKILYQSAELKMVKQGNGWLVDGVSWK